MIRCKLTTKEAAKKAKVTETAIGYWEDRYYYEAMEELENEKRQRKRGTAQKNNRKAVWHQVNSIAGTGGKKL